MFGIPHFQRLDNCSITWRGVVVDVLANTDTLEQEGRRLAAACLYLEDHGIKPDHANLTQLWRRIALAVNYPALKRTELERRNLIEFG